MPDSPAAASAPSTIIVTGASGFIGSAVMTCLAADAPAPCSLRQAFADAGIDADARRPNVEALLALPQNLHAVIHCAGNASIRSSLENPEADLRAALDPAYAWLELLRRRQSQAPFVFMSSSAVYGSATDASSEGAALTPVSPYGLHKAMTEDLIRFYGRVHGIRATILRPFSVIGIGQRKQLIWDALCRFRRGDGWFEGGGDNLRDFIDVRDVAAFVPFALSAASADVPTFNVSTGIGTTVRSAMRKLAEAYGMPTAPHFGSRSFAGDPKVLVGINTAATSLGWTPKLDLDTSLSQITQWFRTLPSA